MEKLFRRHYFKVLLHIIISAIILINVMVFVHAYKFTHFNESSLVRFPESPDSLAFQHKIKLLTTGVDIPKKQSLPIPDAIFKKVALLDPYNTTIWENKTKNKKATIVLFHGYAGAKSDMLGYANLLLDNDYNVVLVGFIGSDDSALSRTTLGIKEAEQVQLVYDYVLKKEEKVVLMGTSMGAVAISRAIDQFQIQPMGQVLIAPFESLRNAVHNRFDIIGVPKYFVADLFLQYGSLLTAIDIEEHNTATYAKSIETPTLLLYGLNDKRVTRDEIVHIANSLSGPKKVATFMDTGHSDFLTSKDQRETKAAILNFLDALQ